jgi:peptide/nickel transport system substrate-binding protein
LKARLRFTVILVLGLICVQLVAACSEEGQPTNVSGTPGAPQTPQIVGTPTPTPVPPTPTYTPLPISPTPQPTATPPLTTGGKLTGAVINDGLTLHPYKTNNTTGENYIKLLYAAGLTRRDPETLLPVANAAASWTISDTSVTFTLKENLKWSDGRALTSADYLWTYQQAKKQENDWPLARAAFYNAAVTGSNGIENYEAPDARTIIVKLHKASSDMVSRADAIEPLPKHIWEKLDWNKGAQANLPPVVSGPWKLREWKRGVSLTLEANTASSIYPTPRTESLIFLVLPDSAVAAQKMKNGELDFFTPPVQDWATFEKLPNVQAYSWLQGRPAWYYAGVNFRKTTLQDKYLRQALMWAVDRQAILDKYAASLGQFANSSVPPASPAFEMFTARYEYKPDKAREVLEKNGYRIEGGKLTKNGQAVPPIKLIHNAPSQLYEGIANTLKTNWAELGVQLEVRNFDFENFQRQLSAQNPDFDLFLSGWTTGYDPENFGDIWRAVPDLNSGAYDNQKLLGLYMQASSQTDPAKRKELLSQIQNIEAEELPYLFLFAETGRLVAAKRVAGFDPKLLGPARNLYTDWFVVR